jgi:hypothetical protein
MYTVVETCFVAVLAGGCWFQMPRTEKRMADTASFLFFGASFWLFTALFAGVAFYSPASLFVSCIPYISTL